MSWIPTTCAKCGRLCNTSECYINKNTGEIWCVNCLALERRARQQEYANTTHGSYHEIMRKEQKSRHI